MSKETIELQTPFADIEAEVTYQIDNDGIGPYEYWGQQCYDHGQDYISIIGIKPIFTDEHDQETREAILKYVSDEKALSDSVVEEKILSSLECAEDYYQEYEHEY